MSVSHWWDRSRANRPELTGLLDSGKAQISLDTAGRKPLHGQAAPMAVYDLYPKSLTKLDPVLLTRASG